MTHINELIEQHIREHESRLKHIDELLQRTRRKVADQQQENKAIGAELEEAKRDREQLYEHIQAVKQSPQYWSKNALEKAGPMGVWDAVAQRLEKLVERIESKKQPE